MSRAWRWFLGSTGEPLTPWRTILWWEARRVPYNAFLFLLGCIAVPIFFVAIMHSGKLKPGEDAVEPLTLLVVPVLANVAYTLGWLTEIVVILFHPPDARRVGPSLLRAGLGVSAVVVLAPAVVWATRLVLR
jgi:hypothetical protein